ncbi:MAG: competence/damage-inducible protein A [Phycisphaerales bacterium]|nr:competence/damage-inducible protein A [Phycisphaerales bacterium]
MRSATASGGSVASPMRASILAIGDELVLGAVSDRHAQWLSSRLVGMGCVVIEHRTVGDDLAHIAAAIGAFAAQSDVVLITGGLGPTDDDLTRDALCRAMGDTLVDDADARDALRARFESRRMPIPEMNWRQATRPSRAVCIPNPHGTAPGLHATVGAALVWAMPGPPREMQPMWEAHVAPRIADACAARGCAGVRTHALHSCGLPESVAAERIRPWMARGSNPVIGTTASGAVISARIRAEGPEAERLVGSAADAVRTAWEPYVFGEQGTTLASAVGALLAQARSSVSVAESCTGGLLGGALTEVPGSSAWFVGGILSYANAVKERALGVTPQDLAQHGAVSRPVALAMAHGVAGTMRTRWGVSTTGIAGPDGGTADKPVGTVWIAVHDAESRRDDVRCFRFTGDRESVRDRSVKVALQMLRLNIVGRADVDLLWQWNG